MSSHTFSNVVIAKLDDRYVALLLSFKGAVTGTVFDANGNILSGALVSVAGEMINTSKSGQFTLENKPYGSYSVGVSYKKWHEDLEDKLVIGPDSYEDEVELHCKNLSYEFQHKVQVKD